jgi:hypothetical protein
MAETSFPDTALAPSTQPGADTGAPLDEQARATIAWLESEFPDWRIDIDESASWQGELRPLWIARRDGHHPQAELSPAKLHTRLDDYHKRNEARRALSN